MGEKTSFLLSLFSSLLNINQKKLGLKNSHYLQNQFGDNIMAYDMPINCKGRQKIKQMPLKRALERLLEIKHG